ncbi:MAG TPA: CHASE3 domain-containing protein [Candidatus Acidoferrum sp.]|jgi:signal transduction histidine kinase
MHRLSGRTLWFLTAFTLVGLLIIALAAARATSDYSDSMNWLSHSLRVETEIAEIRSNLFAAQNGRFQYVFADQPEGLPQYREAADAVTAQLAQLRSATADNPAQRSLLTSLSAVIDQQLITLRTSTEMKLQGGSTELQDQFSNTIHGLSQATSADLDSLQREEKKLLSVRRIISEKTYRTQKVVLSVSFLVVLLFCVLSFAELMFQLRERQNAELVVRRLNGRILQVQDEERRKLARDLHDGIGQIFTALKMSLVQVSRADSSSLHSSDALSECMHLVDEGLSQSRTLSYLLHPPMLDEVGFAAAASWLVDGFSERSKIKTTLDVPHNLKLARELELTLFRVLQEGLTNIHRHSESDRAEIVVTSGSGTVTMTIKDSGKGISEKTLENFKNTAAPSGVGLAGMRGRVADVNGTLELEPANPGTIVRVCVPFVPAPRPVATIPKPSLEQLQPASAPKQDSPTPSPLNP